MTEKSYVGMGLHVCPVCGTEHDEVVLLDKRLRNTLERDNFMGYALCPEHAALRVEYIALVECKNSSAGKSMKMEEADRTGVIAHIRRTAAKQIFNMPLPDDLDFVFVEVGVIEALKARST